MNQHESTSASLGSGGTTRTCWVDPFATQRRCLVDVFIPELATIIAHFCIGTTPLLPSVQVCARDKFGRWYEATIHDPKENALLVHFNGWPCVHDVWLTPDSDCIQSAAGPLEPRCPLLNMWLHQLEAERPPLSEFEFLRLRYNYFTCEPGHRARLPRWW